MNQVLETIRENLLTVIGILFAALLTLAYVALFAGSIVPLWQSRAVLNRQFDALSERQTEQAEGVQQIVDQQQGALVSGRRGGIEDFVAVEVAK